MTEGNEAAHARERAPQARRLFFTVVLPACAVVAAVVFGAHMLGEARRGSVVPLPPLEIVFKDGQETVQIDLEALRRFVARAQLTDFPDLTQLPVEVAEAIHAGLEGVARKPRDGEAWGHLGRILESRRMPAAAVPCYGHAMEHAPDAFEWAYHKGHVLDTMQQVGPAIEAYEHAVKLNPDYPPTHRLLGTLYLESGEPDKAEQAFRRFMRFRPQSSHGYVGLARLAFERARFDEVVRQLQEALKYDPQDYRAHQLLGQAYQRLGQEDRAAYHLDLVSSLSKRVIVDDPLIQAMLETNTSAEGLEERMRAALGAGRAGLAVELGEQLCRRFPEDGRRMHNLAVAYMQARRGPEALERAEKAIVLEPSNLTYHCTKAELLLLMRRLPEALELLDWIVAQDPEHYEGNYYRGAAQMLMEQTQEGLQSFREAVRLREDSVMARIALGKALEAVGQRDEALEQYRLVNRMDAANSLAIQKLREYEIHSQPAP